MNRYKEINSVIKVQRAVKTYLARKKIFLLKDVTLEIQKNLKGFFEREAFNLRKNEKNSHMNLHFYKYHVEKIQYHWIGYKYRKYKKDYKARKKYLEETNIINKETLNLLGDWTNNMLYQREKEMYDNQRKTFDNLCTNLHHLISTKTQPGVYNSPYLPDESKPSVFGANVEKHLQNNIKLHNLANPHLQSSFNVINQGKVDINELKQKIEYKKHYAYSMHNKKLSPITPVGSIHNKETNLYK